MEVEIMIKKRFNLWDIQGTAFIEDHKEGSYHIGKIEDVDINSLRNITKRLNIYTEENEQLKQFKEKTFSLLDKEIIQNEKAIEWGKETGADYGSIGFYNHMLKRLKKELKE